MEDYRYYMDENEVMRLQVVQDPDACSPRYDFDGNIGKMMCWHRNYQLGDYEENTFKTPDDFINSLVRDHVAGKTIISFVKRKKTSNDLSLQYNRSEKKWELWGYYKVWWNGRKVHHGDIASADSLEDLVGDIIEALSSKDKWALLEKHAKIIYLPLYLFDHSGLSMSTGDFGDPWDSGQVGYIYASYEDAKSLIRDGACYKSKKGDYVKVTERNWKEALCSTMNDEVETYDLYLQGRVYGILTEKYDPEPNTWEPAENSFGFISESFGEELIEKLASEMGVSGPMYESLEELEAATAAPVQNKEE